MKVCCKQKVKNSNGITLIALIVTIIVLLILVAVSIAYLAGENGVIARAIESKDLANREDARGIVEVEVVGSYDDSGFNEEKFKEKIQNELGVDPDDILKDGDDNIVFPYNDYEITVRDNKETNQMEVLVEKGVWPKVKINVGTVTGTTIEVNVEVLNRRGGTEEGNFEYYIQDEELPREVTESNNYKYRNLTPQTLYKIKVAFTDKKGKRKTVSEKVTTGEAIPAILSVDLATKTPYTLTIKANADHELDEKLKYDLYIGSELKATLEDKTAGEDIYITAQDLSNYTDYEYHIVVTDQSNHSVESETKSAKTQCSGITQTCSVGHTWECNKGSIKDCNGKGAQYTCTGRGSQYTCNGKGSQYTCNGLGTAYTCNGKGSSYTCSGKGSSYTCSGKGSSYTCSNGSSYTCSGRGSLYTCEVSQGYNLVDWYECVGGTNEAHMTTEAQVEAHLAKWKDHKISIHWAACPKCGAGGGSTSTYRKGLTKLTCWCQRCPHGKLETHSDYNPCSHGQTSSHTVYNYCSHGYYYSHTAYNPCSHGQTTSHTAYNACSHGNTSSHTAYNPCSHGQTSSHTAYNPCSHGQTSSHTAYNPCSHGQTVSHTAYNACEHGQTVSHTAYKPCSHNQTTPHKYNVPCEHQQVTAHTVEEPCDHGYIMEHKYCEHNFDGKAHD